MNLEDKVENLENVVHGLRPMVMLQGDTLQAMDVRQRSNEKELENHAVEIQHINKDLDGIGTKFREIEKVQGIRAAGESGKWWVDVLEFLNHAPKWFKVLAYSAVFAFLTWMGSMVGWFFEARQKTPLPPFWHQRHGEIP